MSRPLPRTAISTRIHRMKERSNSSVRQFRFRSNSYAGSGTQILTDPTGERRNRQFRQRFRGLRSCRPNPSGGSGLDILTEEGIKLKANRLPAETPRYDAVIVPSRYGMDAVLGNR